MNRKLLTLPFYGLLSAAVVYLCFVDYSEKLEKDVSSILPQSESDAARIARQLIDEQQGRAVYLQIIGFTSDKDRGSQVEEAIDERLGKSSLIQSVVKIDPDTNVGALKAVGENRLELLFPKWFFDKRKQFEELEPRPDEFPDWAAKRAVEEMGAFLESPMAMELARPELLDPLLLGINALLVMDEQEPEGDSALSHSDSSRLYWLMLNESPFSPSTQESLQSLMSDLSSDVSSLDYRLEVRYGGLAKLAGASRERIQKDVYTINLISILGVLVVASLLAPNPWRLGWAIPSLLAGAVGAVTVSFLVFEQVNILVLIIGSILIGTTIDYSIHLIFRDHNTESFPTENLVLYACLSTVVGFSILLFAELALIRQIGVFVGSGLVVAFAMARLSIRPRERSNRATVKEAKSVKIPPLVLHCFAGVVMITGIAGLTQLDWKDDLRNLEAPDAELIREDVALREQFGEVESKSVFITTGSTYLDVFQSEFELFQLASGKGFGYSKFLPRRVQVNLLREYSREIPQFFVALKEAFASEGYDLDSFDPFFQSAATFQQDTGFGDAFFEDRIQELADSLVGPMSGALGKSNEMRWSLSSIGSGEDQSQSLARSSDKVTLFSKLSFLNQTLDRHREVLFRFGMIAMFSVAVVIVIVFGWRKGSLIVIYPILGGSAAIGICSLLFPSLNMFHLIGCFLGGAIALDYSLFSIESYARGLPIPRSVWISAGTTNASFLALTFSAIPVVQGLGAVVALLSCVTLLLLFSNQSVLRRIL